MVLAACGGETAEPVTVPADTDLEVHAVSGLRWDQASYTAPAGEINVALVIDRLSGLRNLDAFASSAPAPEGSPGYFGNGYTDANGAYWQELNLQALSQQPEFLSISA